MPHRRSGVTGLALGQALLTEGERQRAALERRTAGERAFGEQTLQRMLASELAERAAERRFGREAEFRREQQRIALLINLANAGNKAALAELAKIGGIAGGAPSEEDKTPPGVAPERAFRDLLSADPLVRRFIELSRIAGETLGPFTGGAALGLGAVAAKRGVQKLLALRRAGAAAQAAAPAAAAPAAAAPATAVPAPAPAAPPPAAAPAAPTPGAAQAAGRQAAAGVLPSKGKMRGAAKRAAQRVTRAAPRTAAAKQAARDLARRAALERRLGPIPEFQHPGILGTLPEQAGPAAGRAAGRALRGAARRLPLIGAAFGIPAAVEAAVEPEAPLTERALGAAGALLGAPTGPEIRRELAERLGARRQLSELQREQIIDTILAQQRAGAMPVFDPETGELVGFERGQ